MYRESKRLRVLIRDWKLFSFKENVEKFPSIDQTRICFTDRLGYFAILWWYIRAWHKVLLRLCIPATLFGKSISLIWNHLSSVCPTIFIPRVVVSLTNFRLDLSTNLFFKQLPAVLMRMSQNWSVGSWRKSCRQCWPCKNFKVLAKWKKFWTKTF